MRAPKLRELREAIVALVAGPYTTRFPLEPSPAPAYRGRPTPTDACVGCGACAQVCPVGAIAIEDLPAGEDGTAVRRIRRRLDECIFCGQCQLSCTAETGVVLAPEYDLACFDRSDLEVVQEMPLVLCEDCGAPLGTLRHLAWLRRKLGPAAYGSPHLILAEEPPLREPPLEAPRHQDIFKILCSRCRQKVLLRDSAGPRLAAASRAS
ncbi:MAG: 4Fe-4S dicluster domain-containing protein [Planctomycetes bacterium]|nr:4Fe-4S dicluster domain-containing protein [Planctomycetota bacterium]